MSKKELKNNSGFTLAEMLVSVAVIVIVSAMSLVSFRSTNRSASSSMAAQKLASDIRMVQGWALSLKDFNGAPPNGGWGIRFKEDDNQYIIFADIDESKKYRSGEDGTPNNEKYKVIELLNGVTISELRIGGFTNRDYGYIVFIPPEPMVKIGGSANENNDILQIKDTNEIEIEFDGGVKVTVNKYGMVDVD